MTIQGYCIHICSLQDILQNSASHIASACWTQLFKLGKKCYYKSH